MSNMPESYVTLLLQIIKSNGSVDSLVKIGYNYVQIAESMIEFRQNNIVKGVENNIVLTDEGLDLLKTLNNNSDRHGLARLVSPKIDAKIEPIGIFDIYLPTKKPKLG